MSIVNRHNVVEQMIGDLAARRRARVAHRAAYLALARAIVLHDERQERLVPQGQHGPSFDWESAEAA
jgi:hypothetical protein